MVLSDRGKGMLVGTGAGQKSLLAGALVSTLGLAGHCPLPLGSTSLRGESRRRLCPRHFFAPSLPLGSRLQLPG